MALPLLMTCALEIGFVDKRRSPRAGITDATSFTNYANFASPATLDAALTSAIPGHYTAAKLQTLSVNDKIWALRQLQEAASI